MKRIKDSHILGVVAGLLGWMSQFGINSALFRLGYSKRTYITTGAGVWVKSYREANSSLGKTLGLVYNIALTVFGSIIKLSFLKRLGRDHLITKGLLYGVGYGAFVTGILNTFLENKIKPKDASTNLCYVIANAVYGLVTTFALAKLGDDSLFSSSQKQNQTSQNEVVQTNETLKEFAS